MLKVIFAGGGTGGHLMAGISIAEEISSRFPDASIVFFCTDLKKEAGYLKTSGYQIKQIRAQTLTSFLSLPKFLFVSTIGIFRSLIHIVAIRPDIVVGLGGYGSALPVVAAYFCRVPIVLIEQNSIPGRANRMMARWVDTILCHWENTAKMLHKARSIRVTGIPVRKDIIRKKTEKEYKIFGFSRQEKTLLIMGGSQGAQTINRVLLQSLPKLKKMIPELQIIHLTGKLGYGEAKTVYKSVGIRAFIAEYFEEMSLIYGIADLIISRSGANTVAEIAEIGAPAIFIPYPYATDDHQYWNAHELSQNGGAIIIKQEELNPEMMTETIFRLLTNSEKLHEMRGRNKKQSKPFAAKRAVDGILQTLAEKKKGAGQIFERNEDQKENEPYYTRTVS
ncbi:MAG: undecaprenyldiphospho-muramoylpentapeptide beta-N-acetylglucosaminyltransferase [Candidatus Scalindua sp. AMX11]|nr:MAG: undecaprenyldiphospho-muramoylpentapeptide beta-N-acetylglucosaminyltransferase [Candidatus Scalindua sp.]NOG85605.1 undecaprenyldiphospho-muramoylpentapeptide beta-N-acetylglucosaminyltransferase [Planctomycetota bacterium]RZV65371.1 MAG: undecaprenyldiphospho-muramoylpentapeptide beta-N-acetylglucosaminyltransferase [Candidatus Scalindua sp. SCAELEC01]TDE63475.1 MAG: undecaprenyldiphospho-muramoylpentapeptide beta-N-acetylglucosaminyltransferase [Candidatus Scalindua sp. AMX11]GJQ5729